MKAHLNWTFSGAVLTATMLGVSSVLMPESYGSVAMLFLSLGLYLGAWLWLLVVKGRSPLYLLLLPTQLFGVAVLLVLENKRCLKAAPVESRSFTYIEVSDITVPVHVDCWENVGRPYGYKEVKYRVSLPMHAKCYLCQEEL